MGGFNDGLVLLAEALLSIYTASAFSADHLNNRYVDSASGKQFAELSKSPAFMNTIKKINDGEKLERDQVRSFKHLANKV